MGKNIYSIEKFLIESQSSSGWKTEGKVLAKEFKFRNFGEVILFVNAVAEIAEIQNHHPRMIVDYDKVKIETFTHDENKITTKDFSLAKEIDDYTIKK